MTKPLLLSSIVPKQKEPTLQRSKEESSPSVTPLPTQAEPRRTTTEFFRKIQVRNLASFLLKSKMKLSRFGPQSQLFIKHWRKISKANKKDKNLFLSQISRQVTSNTFNQRRTFIQNDLKSFNPERLSKEVRSLNQQLKPTCLPITSSRSNKRLRRRSSIQSLKRLSTLLQNCSRITIHWWWRRQMITEIYISLSKKRQSRWKRNRVSTMEVP